ncbi:hypothetical protein [Brevibacillus sp. SYSU BS000544]|uniref:hypothetical protein n=1 Tax=Brevibacillus sp. SYSU BS000544 TaxID=3416443 RepID=UPI003CE56F97
MNRDRLDEEALLVNGRVGGEVLTKQERNTLRREAAELKTKMEEAKHQEIKE